MEANKDKEEVLPLLIPPAAESPRFVAVHTPHTPDESKAPVHPVLATHCPVQTCTLGLVHKLPEADEIVFVCIRFPEKHVLSCAPFPCSVPLCHPRVHWDHTFCPAPFWRVPSPRSGPSTHSHPSLNGMKSLFDHIATQWIYYSESIKLATRGNK